MNKKFVYQVGNNKKKLYYDARPTKYKKACTKLTVTHIHKCPPLVTLLCQINPLHILLTRSMFCLFVTCWFLMLRTCQLHAESQSCRITSFRLSVIAILRIQRKLCLLLWGESPPMCWSNYIIRNMYYLYGQNTTIFSHRIVHWVYNYMFRPCILAIIRLYYNLYSCLLCYSTTWWCPIYRAETCSCIPNVLFCVKI